MTLSSLGNFCYSTVIPVTSTVITNGVVYGIEGAVAGVALGVLGAAFLDSLAARSQSGASHSGLVWTAAIIMGAQYGATLGTIYGLGKGVLTQIV